MPPTPDLDAFELLGRHCRERDLFELVAIHSVLVARKAQEIARARLERRPAEAIDLDFLAEASLLHDIGVARCNAPEILCRGTEPYIRHGVLGREILESEGLPRHALACERHTGAGITREEVLEQGLPLPDRDYMPVSIEEKIICVADKFYSKTPARIWDERSPDAIRSDLARWGPRVVERWDALCRDLLP